jgi:hypothetical protein
MRIGHSGRTRVEELILAPVLFIIAIRTALPIGNSAGVYGHYWVKILFAALIATPAIWLWFAHTLTQRKHALLAVVITYGYCGLLVGVLDWTRFAAAAAILGCGGIAGYLYYLTREEISWIQQQSSPSPPPAPRSSGTP